MNIILLTIIFIIIVYSIYIKTHEISNFTNTIESTNNTVLLNETICDKNPPIIPKELIYNNYTYNLVGTGINNFYNQKYYLYETKNDQYGDLFMKDNLEYLDGEIYSYIFVNYINNKPIIDHIFGPRNKIKIGDVIYIEQKYLLNGINYIGPYIIL